MGLRTVIKSFFFTCTILFLLNGCVNDVDLDKLSKEVKIDASLIVPIGSATVSINDLLKKLGTQDYLDTTNNQMLVVAQDSIEYVYRVIKPLEYTVETKIPFLPTSVGIVGVVPPNTTIPTIEKTDSIKLGLNTTPGERIDQLDVATATISFSVTPSAELSSIPASNLVFTVTFPGNQLKKKNGDPYVLTVHPTAYGVLQQEDLTDFIILTPNSSSGFPMKMTVDAKTGSLPLTVGVASEFSTKTIFNNLSYTAAWGRFEPTKLIADLVKIPLNLPAEFANLKFSNPQIDISLTNNVGVPLFFDISYVKAYDNSNAEIAKASFNGNDGRIYHFNRPIVPGESALTSIKLDKDTGDTHQLFASGKVPSTLECKFTSGLITTDNALSFITPTAKIKAKVKIKIPVQFDAGNYYEMTDSIKDAGASFRSTFKEATVENMTLVLDITNGLPFATTFQFVNLKDSLGTPILQSLVQSYKINAPDVNTAGEVTTKHVQQLRFELNKAQIEEFKRMKDLKFTVRVGGQDDTKAISFNRTNNFTVKLGAYVKGGIIKNLDNK